MKHNIMNNGKFEWKSKDKKISELTNTEIIEVYFFKKLSPFLTVLTKYFPFSLLWRDRRFYYKYKDVVEMDDLIVKIATKNKFWFKFISFERYNRLLVIIGKFIPIKKNLKEDVLIRHFESYFADKKVYIIKQDKGTIKFSTIIGDN